jgi:ubiquinone/menaquinone biosynthesis C-methylase UbiE
MQNIYDDPRFFAGYRDLRDTGRGLNDALEQPALRALLPPLAGLDVLDLGCGEGSFGRWCGEQGARSVIGVDLSRRMLALGAERTADPRIRFVRSGVEQIAFRAGSFDLVVGSYVLHYVEDYAAAVGRIFGWLRPGGSFVFSVEHPVMTAQVESQGWATDHVGRRLFWALDDYADEGARRSRWFVDGVLKFHRRTATLVNGLLDAGFVLTRLDEPEPTPEALAAGRAAGTSGLLDNRRRPPVLVLAARKPE